jgi:hypothetical protein
LALFLSDEFALTLASPSPMDQRNLELPNGTAGSRRSYWSGNSLGSKRPSIVTANLSSDHLNALGQVNGGVNGNHEHVFGMGTVPGAGGLERSRSAKSASERAVAWRDRGKATAMLRTASDGADVVIEENGLEWEVVNPHGVGKRDAPVDFQLRRRHSLQDRLVYRELRVSPA